MAEWAEMRAQSLFKALMDRPCQDDAWEGKEIDLRLIADALREAEARGALNAASKQESFSEGGLEDARGGADHTAYNRSSDHNPESLNAALRKLTKAADRACDAIDFRSLGGEAQDAFMELEQTLVELESANQESKDG